MMKRDDGNNDDCDNADDDDDDDDEDEDDDDDDTEINDDRNYNDPISVLEPVSRKSRELFGPEKPFVKLRSAYSVKLLFSYVVKGIKIKITAKFRASRRLRFEDTKRIMSPEIRPKRFGTFEKQAPGGHVLKNHSNIMWLKD